MMPFCVGCMIEVIVLTDPRTYSPFSFMTNQLVLYSLFPIFCRFIFPYVFAEGVETRS